MNKREISIKSAHLHWHADFYTPTQNNTDTHPATQTHMWSHYPTQQGSDIIISTQKNTVIQASLPKRIILTTLCADVATFELNLPPKPITPSLTAEQPGSGHGLFAA